MSPNRADVDFVETPEAPEWYLVALSERGAVAGCSVETPRVAATFRASYEACGYRVERLTADEASALVRPKGGPA